MNTTECKELIDELLAAQQLIKDRTATIIDIIKNPELPLDERFQLLLAAKNLVGSNNKYFTGRVFGDNICLYDDMYWERRETRSIDRVFDTLMEDPETFAPEVVKAFKEYCTTNCFVSFTYDW